MSGDELQARVQRIEADVRGLHETVDVLAVVGGDGAKKLIRDVFSDARTVIIFRGIQKGKTQLEIAAALKERGLKKYFQPDVSRTVAMLEDNGFVEKPPRGSHVVRMGWNKYGLERMLKKTLRDAQVDDL